jgi:L-threonylcarbamoyladenylate synthase
LRTCVVKIDPLRPDKGVIAAAAADIAKGRLVGFPTETVYGIAANFLDKEAVARLYEIKKRPKDKPFTVHIADIGMIESLGAALSKEALALAGKFWPGPLTMVLKTDSGGTLGFRIPANEVALGLLRKAGVPVVAPSANLSGGRSPVSAQEALKDLDGMIDTILDSGPTTVGVESTVVDMTVSPPKILREGAISAEEIFECLG